MTLKGRTLAIRLSSSCSNSASVQNSNGFLVAPSSLAWAVSLVIVSSILVRVADPGGASKYCLTSAEANPPLPPNRPMTRSSTSLTCGTFSPPVDAPLRKRSTAAFSMSSSVRCLRALALLACWLARHVRHRLPRFPWLLKANSSRGVEAPQTLQGFSSMPKTIEAQQALPC